MRIYKIHKNNIGFSPMLFPAFPLAYFRRRRNSSVNVIA